MTKRTPTLITVLASALLCFACLAACSSGASVAGSASQAQAPESAQAAAVANANAHAHANDAFDAEAYMQRLDGCVQQIRAKTDFVPDIVIVLGSGLGHFAEQIDVVAEIPYEEIDGFPVTTVSDHEGKLVFGTLGGKNVVVMQGRVHYYEGYSMQEVVLPIRVLHLLGANTVVLTNAVGAINVDYQVGDFVAVQDHISSFVPSPLVGENLDELGKRFPDMTEIYDRKLVDLACEIGAEKDIAVHRGTFVQTTGPQFETPAEIRMYRSLGADTVGMSTAVEAIAARHMGMRVCDINCVTNMAAGVEDTEIATESISASADEAAERFTVLLREFVTRME